MSPHIHPNHSLPTPLLTAIPCTSHTQSRNQDCSPITMPHYRHRHHRNFPAPAPAPAPALPPTFRKRELPSWYYVLKSQLHPYNTNQSRRATTDVYTTQDEAKLGLWDYAGRNYAWWTEISNRPGGLTGCEGRVLRCLNMQRDEVTGRAWVVSVQTWE
ncbi:hypothetical protein BU23DRAFT_162106 [Bimuria novae-zelandiae CBS 107.79]|uniref:Uncharacterized protein n=1 Tax=Bimuria novae-zelandiae CBS 107.79 TaxID=1447943 RepID=A0A6A5V5D8_9PLEO|nr:hypothetical protein BU23DRAFT_162106 [Bimuria novae-zelandiae CBS 107.79]